MNDHDLDLLIRSSLERDAARQPVSGDLHQRSVSYGKRVVRRRRVAGVSGTVAAVVAAVAVIGVSLGGTKHPGPTTTPSSTTPSSTTPPVVPTLSTIATHVATLSSDEQKTSPWWYSRTQQTAGGKTDVYEDWLPRGGSVSATIRVHKDGVAGGDAVSRLADGADSSVSQWGATVGEPVDAKALLERIQSQVTAELGPGASQAVTSAAEFEAFLPYLELGEFPPAQRSAALADLATVPGVVTTGLQNDSTGRSGLKLTPPDVGFGAGQSVLIDPATGLLLEETQTTPAGAVTRTTFLISAGVPDALALPPGVVAVGSGSQTSAAPSPGASVRLWESQPPPNFLAAVQQQALRKAAFTEQLSLPADIVGDWVVDESAVLPDGTELVIGHYSDAAEPRSSVWFTGLGDQVQEAGLGDPLKGGKGVFEYVVHGAKNQALAEPWQWVVVVGTAATTKVEIARTASAAWTPLDTMHGIAVTATSAISSATSRVRLFAGGGSPYLTGHLAVLPVHRYGS